MKDTKKNTRTHDAQLWPSEQQTTPFQENVSELCTVCCYRPHRWCFTRIFFPLSFYWNMFVIVVRSLAFYCFILFLVFSSLKSVRYGWKTNIRRCLEPEMGVVLDLKKSSPSAPGNVLPLRGCGLCGDYTECRPLKKTDSTQEILSLFSFLFFYYFAKKKYL